MSHTLTVCPTQEQQNLQKKATTTHWHGIRQSLGVKQQLASDPEFIKNGYAEYQQEWYHKHRTQHNLSSGFIAQTKTATMKPEHWFSRSDIVQKSRNNEGGNHELSHTKKWVKVLKRLKNATPLTLI